MRCVFAQLTRRIMMPRRNRSMEIEAGAGAPAPDWGTARPAMPPDGDKREYSSETLMRRPQNTLGQGIPSRGLVARTPPRHLIDLPVFLTALPDRHTTQATFRNGIKTSLWHVHDPG